MDELETTPDETVQQTEEARATLSGWTPEDQFKGASDRWVDAEAWNKRSDELMPILKATNSRLEGNLNATQRELGATQKELASLKKTMDQIVKVNETVSQREYDRARETLLKEQATAIEANDGEKWEALERTKVELEESKPEKVVLPEPPDQNDQARSNNHNVFLQRNGAWYGTGQNHDAEMTAFAVLVGSELASQGWPEAMQYPEIEKRTREKFAHKFGNNRRNEASVDTSTQTPTQKGKSGYNSLPADAKAACDAHIKSVSSRYPNANLKTVQADWVKAFEGEA